MWSDVINNVIALVLGVVTGLYFERRATKQARRDADEATAHNVELQETLRNLRAELVTRSSVPPSQQRATSGDPADLADRALSYARECQDASGRIRSSTLRNGLIARGFAVADADLAIGILADRGTLRQDGTHWEVTA